MPGGLEMLLGALLPLAAILLLAYWSSRYLGKRWGYASSGKNLKVIDRIQVGADRYLLLVALKEHTYLIGVSDSGIRLLAEPEGTFEEPEQGEDIKGFREVLKACGAFKEKKGERHE